MLFAQMFLAIFRFLQLGLYIFEMNLSSFRYVHHLIIAEWNPNLWILHILYISYHLIILPLFHQLFLQIPAVVLHVIIPISMQKLWPQNVFGLVKVIHYNLFLDVLIL